jgi:hypothetical protein
MWDLEWSPELSPVFVIDLFEAEAFFDVREFEVGDCKRPQRYACYQRLRTVGAYHQKIAHVGFDKLQRLR